jgi:sulfhydrogenase subunit alpha
MKTITIEHLARVEGNGGVTATIDGNKVTEVRFFVNEAPRLIERLTVGKTPEEDVNLVPRICAICTLSHKYAVLRAMERALAVNVPPKVTLLRDLMHLGEMIESHSLHTYLLALPDYLGFPNAIAMAAKHPFEAKIALEMKQFGNHIMAIMSGRYIHGENPVIGGFGKYPSREELLWIKNRALQFLPFALKTAKIFAELSYPDSPEAETQYACCNPGDGKYGFVGDEIIVSGGEIIDAQDYRTLTHEYLVSHSYCKRSLYKDRPYSVGALARVNNLGERLDGEAGKAFKKYFGPRWKKNPLFNNAAQALELLFSFERVPAVIDQALKLPDPGLVKYTKTAGKGAGAVEAPRGTLFHYYEITKGRVSFSDIITPTAQNADDIERYCLLAAQKLLDAGKEESIRARMDLVIRSYDPCISCSVHLAEVSKAPEDNWREQLSRIPPGQLPVFVGLGLASRSDDGVGARLALALRESGFRDAWLEPEPAAKDLCQPGYSSRPIIFIDALDFGERPGRIAFFPLRQAAWNSGLSHRLSPFLGAGLTYAQLENSYLLGIQPERLEEGDRLSEPVRKALERVLDEIKHRPAWRS